MGQKSPGAAGSALAGSGLQLPEDGRRDILAVGVESVVQALTPLTKGPEGTPAVGRGRQLCGGRHEEGAQG